MKCISEPIVDEPGPPPVYKLPVEEKMCMSVDRSGRKICKCWVGEPPIEQCPEKVHLDGGWCYWSWQDHPHQWHGQLHSGCAMEG